MNNPMKQVTNEKAPPTKLHQAHSHRCFELRRGEVPLLISVPHTGTEIPDTYFNKMSSAAQGSMDSDWFMKELYEPIAINLGASIISPQYSRYLIDLNRPQNDESLYPGQTTTGLCPSERFDGLSLYPNGDSVSVEDKQERIEFFWKPYHHALKAELDRLKQRHGYALLWEGHSIKSVVPRLFEGRLPDLNLGTNQGLSCSSLINSSLEKSLNQLEDHYSWVLNGRFKGGYITRHYGQPQENIHAVQLELTQCNYLADENNPLWDEEYAQPISKVIQTLIESCLYCIG